MLARERCESVVKGWKLKRLDTALPTVAGSQALGKREGEGFNLDKVIHNPSGCRKK